MPKTSNARFNGGQITNPLIINNSGETAPSFPASNSLQVINNIVVDRVAGGPGITFRRTKTSFAAPTPPISSDSLGQFNAAGYTPAGYTGSRGGINVGAAENWSNTANGTFMTFAVTPNGAVATIAALQVFNDGSLQKTNLATTFLNAAGLNVLRSFTVGTLPAASASARALAWVTDAVLTAITGLGVVVTGGGANSMIVYSDGTNWIGI